jgi:hypothetical protein
VEVSCEVVLPSRIFFKTLVPTAKALIIISSHQVNLWNPSDTIMSANKTHEYHTAIIPVLFNASTYALQKKSTGQKMKNEKEGI